MHVSLLAMNANIKYIRRGILSFLAVLIFATSTCFAIDVHTCKGEVKSISFFGKAEACKNMNQVDVSSLPECCKAMLQKKISDDLNLSEKPCCINTSFDFKSLREQENNADISFYSEVDNFKGHFFSEKSTGIHHLRVPVKDVYRIPPPPDLSQNDFRSLYQVFII